MNEPLEDALRQSLAARAAEREPGVNLEAVHGLARRRRVRRRGGAAAAAGLAVALLVAPSLLPLNDRAPDRLDVAGPQAPELAPGELTRRVLDALGEGASVVAPEADLPTGPVDPAEAFAEGKPTRLAGRVVTVAVSGSVTRTYAVRWETLVPTPSDEVLQRGLSRLAEGKPELATAAVGEGRGYAVPLPGGVTAAAVSGGQVLRLDLSTGDPDPDESDLAESALAVLDAVAR
jgi:hypothetical protein